MARTRRLTTCNHVGRASTGIGEGHCGGVCVSLCGEKGDGGGGEGGGGDLATAVQRGLHSSVLYPGRVPARLIPPVDQYAQRGETSGESVYTRQRFRHCKCDTCSPKRKHPVTLLSTSISYYTHKRQLHCIYVYALKSGWSGPRGIQLKYIARKNVM